MSQPEVGIIMGSDSDYPVMKDAELILNELGVSNEVLVVSAHRMPEEMFEYAKSAHLRGVKVIIAGAGGAAHLPGMVAAQTVLPVIGVPVPLKYLDGIDSLLSIVQMPAGVPVATVSIAGAKNAGLLAARMLSIGSEAKSQELQKKLIEYQDHLRTEALKKGDTLRKSRNSEASK